MSEKNRIDYLIQYQGETRFVELTKDQVALLSWLCNDLAVLPDDFEWNAIADFEFERI